MHAHDAVIVRMNLANKCGPLWIVVAMAFVMLMHGYDIHLHVICIITTLINHFHR